MWKSDRSKRKLQHQRWAERPPLLIFTQSASLVSNKDNLGKTVCTLENGNLLAHSIEDLTFFKSWNMSSYKIPQTAGWLPKGGFLSSLPKLPPWDVPLTTETMLTAVWCHCYGCWRRSLQWKRTSLSSGKKSLTINKLRLHHHSKKSQNVGTSLALEFTTHKNKIRFGWCLILVHRWNLIEWHLAFWARP